MRSRRPSLITRNVETWSHGVQAETHQAVKFNQRPEECSLERSIWAPCGTIAQAEHDSFLTFCGQNRQSGNENDPLFNIDPWAGRSLRENGPATNAVAAASSSGGNCAWPRSRITINESGNRAKQLKQLIRSLGGEPHVPWPWQEGKPQPRREIKAKKGGGLEVVEAAKSKKSKGGKGQKRVR